MLFIDYSEKVNAFRIESLMASYMSYFYHLIWLKTQINSSVLSSLILYAFYEMNFRKFSIEILFFLRISGFLVPQEYLYFDIKLSILKIRF